MYTGRWIFRKNKFIQFGMGNKTDPSKYNYIQNQKMDMSNILQDPRLTPSPSLYCLDSSISIG